MSFAFKIVSSVFLFICLAATQAIAEDTLVPAPAIESSPREDLRKELFSDSLATPGCKSLDVGPKGGLLKVAPDLDLFIKKILKGLQTSDAAILAPLFHKRLRVRESLLQEQFTGFAQTYQKPLDFSVYKTWAFNTVDGSVAGFPCMDGLEAFSLYGYPLQIGLWVQVMGQLELGRIYIPIVPLEGTWWIGGFHTQQWTHNGKDFTAWHEAAQKSALQSIPEVTWVLYDISAKLLNGGGLIKFPALEYIQNAQAKLMSKAEFYSSVSAFAKGLKPVYIASILTEDGAGILVRMATPRDLTLPEVTGTCEDIARAMIAKKWNRALAGIKCTYVLPKEDPAKEGVLGGIYLSFAKVKPPAKP